MVVERNLISFAGNSERTNHGATQGMEHGSVLAFAYKFAMIEDGTVY